MTQITHCLVFDTMTQPVCLHDCADLLDRLALLFPGWPIARAAQSAARPVLKVTRAGRGWRFEGDWLREPLLRDDPASAASALVAEVVRAWARDGDHWLCLHGAAAKFAGRLVVFPSRYRAGKSLLAAALAAAGVPLYADDVLPIGIADGRAMAPGLAPRLRLPLPANLDPSTRGYIERHRAFASERYLYLDLADRELVARGESATIGGFVLLEREAGAAPELERIPAAAVLKQVVWQNFARQADAPRILDRLQGLVMQARRYRLRYDRVDEAVALLNDRFSHWSERETTVLDDVPPPRWRGDAAAPPAPGRLRRRGDVEMREVDDECFLADPGGAAIHHLNPVGRAIWTLLAEPVDFDEMAGVLASAFPEVDRERLERDLADLLEALRRKGLIEAGGADRRDAARQPLAEVQEYCAKVAPTREN